MLLDGTSRCLPRWWLLLVIKRRAQASCCRAAQQHEERVLSAATYTSTTAGPGAVKTATATLLTTSWTLQFGGGHFETVRPPPFNSHRPPCGTTRPGEARWCPQTLADAPDTRTHSRDLTHQTVPPSSRFTDIAELNNLQRPGRSPSASARFWSPYQTSIAAVKLIARSYLESGQWRALCARVWPPFTYPLIRLVCPHAYLGPTYTRARVCVYKQYVRECGVQWNASSRSK